MPAYCHPPRDVPAQKPVLLLKRNPDTGKYAYRRTNGLWFGWYELPTAALNAAEKRFGWLPGSYQVQLQERNE